MRVECITLCHVEWATLKMLSIIDSSSGDGDRRNVKLCALWGWKIVCLNCHSLASDSLSLYQMILCVSVYSVFCSLSLGFCLDIADNLDAFEKINRNTIANSLWLIKPLFLYKDLVAVGIECNSKFDWIWQRILFVGSIL